MGRRWLRISSLRLNGDDDAAPVGWTDVYLDEAYAALREVIEESPDTLISTLIETRFGRRIAEIHQDIKGVIVPDALVKRLNVPEGSPGLRVTRRYLDGAGACFEASVSTHPADRFTISMRLQRERD